MKGRIRVGEYVYREFIPQIWVKGRFALHAGQLDFTTRESATSDALKLQPQA